MGLSHEVYSTWRDVMDNKSDPRTTNWFMMSSPLPTIALSLSYICIVKVIGPRIMANRKAFDVKKLQFYYNVAHLGINLFIAFESFRGGWLKGFNYRCQPASFETTGVPMSVSKSISKKFVL